MMNRPGAASCPGSLAEPEGLLPLAFSLLLGMGLGLLYDLLRPPRRAAGSLGGMLLDLAFAAAALAAVFLGALGASRGRLGLWELTADLLGFLFYLHVLSPVILPLAARAYRVIQKTIRLLKKLVENLGKTAKKYFPKLKDWIIMGR